MAGEARGVHAHPTLKLGLRAPTPAKPRLRLGKYLTGAVPAHPLAMDHFGSIPFGLYGNDKYGDCGPTSVANLRRLITATLTGTMVAPSQADVFDLYRRSGNPQFDPNDPGGPGDGGVNMQDMLNAAVKGGIGGVKPLGFAAVDVSSDDELTAADSIFGGTLWGVDLEVAQQSQTDAGRWDYSRSGEWGGHAILSGAYEASGDQDVITWAQRVRATAAFRRHQLQEAWVVIWPEHLSHPAMQEGVDLAALAADYTALTGRPFPADVPPGPAPTPTPAPTPVPVPPAPGGDGCFQVGPFSDRRVRSFQRAAARGGYTRDAEGVGEYLTQRLGG